MVAELKWILIGGRRGRSSEFGWEACADKLLLDCSGWKAASLSLKGWVSFLVCVGVGFSEMPHGQALLSCSSSVADDMLFARNPMIHLQLLSNKVLSLLEPALEENEL
jgi:hypothetical protein